MNYIYLNYSGLENIFSNNIENDSLQCSISKLKEVFSKDIFISKELSGTIKLFDNGIPTFTPFDKIVIDSHFEEIKSQMSADTMKIFTENWSTTKLYPYGDVDLSKMKDTLIFEFDTSSFYCTPSDYLYSAFGPRRGRQHKEQTNKYNKTPHTHRKKNKKTKKTKTKKKKKRERKGKG